MIDPAGSVTPARRAPALACATLTLALAMSAAAQSDVRVFPAGCFDPYGRPLRPDPADPSLSLDPACRPPAEGVIVRGSRASAAAAPGTPSMEPGSVNLPPTPVPVPGGIGVMNP